MQHIKEDKHKSKELLKEINADLTYIKKNNDLTTIKYFVKGMRNNQH